MGETQQINDTMILLDRPKTQMRNVPRDYNSCVKVIEVVINRLFIETVCKQFEQRIDNNLEMHVVGIQANYQNLNNECSWPSA